MNTAKLAPAALLAALALAAPALAAKPAAPAASASFPDADWRTPDPENVLVVDTSKGRVIVELTPWAAPAHVERVKLLVRRGFYDGLTFFRVIDGFMAQTGDPRNDGMGGADDLPDMKAEFTFRRGRGLPATIVGRLPPDMTTPAPTEIGYVGPMVVRGAPEMQMMVAADGRAPAWPLFCAGVLGMARGTAPDTANSQFFFMRSTYPSLDGQYTAFGRVISGLPVVQAIKTGEPVAMPQDVMTRVRVLADIPAAERPKVQVLSTGSPTFRAMIKAAQARGGGAFSPCDLEIPARIG
ncbi:MAG: peptidylprolyl isomerase [Pseudomonadota bacterium]